MASSSTHRGAVLSAVSIVLALGGASHAWAQQPGAIPPWDLSVQTGVFVAHPPVSKASESWDRWYTAGNLGISGGRYLTPHLKIEGEYIYSGSGRRYVQRLIDVPSVGPYPIGTEERIRINSSSGVVIWQFRENQWAHPFVFAGATFDRQTGDAHTWPQFYYRDPRTGATPVQISTDRFEKLPATTTVRALLGTGAKLYVSQRAYFRTDMRIGLGGSKNGHVSFRLGFGFDF